MTFLFFNQIRSRNIRKIYIHYFRDIYTNHKISNKLRKNESIIINLDNSAKRRTHCVYFFVLFLKIK